MTTKFGIVDDFVHWRLALIDIVEDLFEDVEIVVQASNGQELIDALGAMENTILPSVIILDLNMPIMDGFETARWLHLNYPEIRVLTLSLKQDERTIIRLSKFGVMGFCNKDMDGNDLKIAIDSVVKGERYISSFRNQYGHEVKPELGALSRIEEAIAKYESLSKKDKDLVKLCCSELTYDDITKELMTDKIILQRRIGRLFKEFNVHSQEELYLLIYKCRLI